MRKVTWWRFDQSAKQLVVGQTTTLSVSEQVLFVDYRKRLSMSVDRGQKNLARQIAALVCPAKRALYTVDASPALNQYVLLLLSKFLLCDADA